MRITAKGQVTIPQAIREQAGLLPNTEVEFAVDGDVVTIFKSLAARKATRGELLVRNLRAHPSTTRMSTDEIMSLMRGDE